MNDKLIGLIAMLIMLVLGILLGAAIGIRIVEKKAIQNGAAYYDPQSGDLKWIERPPVMITPKRVMRHPDGSISIEPLKKN